MCASELHISIRTDEADKKSRPRDGGGDFRQAQISVQKSRPFAQTLTSFWA